MIGVKTHYNLIADHINYVENQQEKEVYCKRLHKVTVPQAVDCQECPYFAGVMGGYGHECVWEDCVSSLVNEVRVDWSERYDELMRVSKLIDRGLIKKG